MTKYILILFILLLSIPTVLPLFHDGIFSMHDNTQVARVYEMGVALKDGMFPVRWVKDLGYGYGYPIFNFYGPLPYYIGGLFYVITGAATLSTKIMIGIGTLLAGVTMYMLAYRVFGRVAGVVAAITYMYFPYHALNIYVRGAIGETFAYALIPLFFYGLFNLFDNAKNFKKSTPSILTTGIALAGIVVSHNLSAFMLVLMVSPVLLIALFFAENKKIFSLTVISAFILGGMLSAFYAIPALLEMRYTNVTSQIGGGADFRDHFVCVNQLWSSNWGFGGSAPGCIDGISFALGKNNIVLTIGALALVLWYFFRTQKLKNTFPIIASLSMLAFSLFLILPISQFFWERVPAIEFLQFPWRFLNFTSLSISLILASSIWVFQKMKYSKIAIALVVLVLISQVIIHRDVFRAQQYDMTPDDKYLTARNLNFQVSKISDEYLPKGFDKPLRASEIPSSKFEIVEGEGEIINQDATTDLLTARIDVSKDATLRINSAPFPAWTVYVDGQTQTIDSKNNGVYVDLSKGEHEIEYIFKSTIIEKVANSISLIGLAILILGIIALRKK